MVAVLLMETGKSRGGAGLEPGDDEFILRHVDPNLLTVGGILRLRSSHNSMRKN